MGLEVAQFISDLNPQWPTSGDKVREGDDHLRAIKTALVNTFPNIEGQVTLSHTQLNQIPDYLTALVANLPPAGIIVAWSGASDEIPPGWALCNGANSTPDLRGRFIIGAGGDYAVDATGGGASVSTSSESAGAITVDGHALTAAEMPAHQHFVSTADTYTGSGEQLLSSTNYLYRSTDGGPGGDTEYTLRGKAGTASVGLSSSTGGGNTHTHTATQGSHTHTVATLPPYYALCWIMKTVEWSL